MQYLLMPHVRYIHLGVHIEVRLEGKTTRIWSFGSGFICANAMGCVRFKLSFGMIIVL